MQRHATFHVLKNKTPSDRRGRGGNGQNELSSQPQEPVLGQRLADSGKTPHLQRAEVRITAPHRAAVVIMQVKAASKGGRRRVIFKVNRRFKFGKKLACLLIRLTKRAVIIVIINPPHIKHAMTAH